MEAILEIIAVVFLALLFVFSVVVNVMLFFAKERRRNIHVIHKRETLHRNLRGFSQKDMYYSHYTIDCRYPDSDRIHTLDCSYDIFRQLKEGKSYTVSTKMLEITSIMKKSASGKEKLL